MSKTITPARFTGWPKISISTSRTLLFFSMRTAMRRAFSILTKFVTRFEPLRQRRIAKRCSSVGAAKERSNVSTGSNRLCQRPFRKSFGCRPKHSRNLRFAKIDSKQRRCWTATSKQRRENRDLYSEAYVVSDFERLEKQIKGTERLIVTIDLDYFAGLAEAEQEQAFARVWNFVIERPNLVAITFAISRPYLNSEHEADRLLKLALTSALSLPTAKIEFEPFLTVANDHSNLAKRLMAKGETPPAFDVAQSTQDLRARILSQRQHIKVRQDSARWDQLLGNWNNEAPQLHLAVKDREPSTDDVWRVPADESADVELVVEPWTSKPEKIEWFALTPKFWRCNLTDLSADQVGFVANAAPRPSWNELAIDCHDSVLPIAKIANLFDRRLHCGSVRLRARALVDGKVRETPAMELRRFVGSGFRAAVTEQFGLPYLFGSGELSDGSNTGPETNLGADCANFVIYALRRQGQRIPWSDPKQLRQRLDLIARSITPGEARITSDDLQRGTILHLGTHVAAVIEDRNPIGILDENDLVAHQLPVAPELVTLGQLLSERGRNRFDLYRAPSAKAATRLMFGGDVMLGRSCAEKIQSGTDPFEGISSLVHQASFAAANLECTISNLGVSTKRYAFRAPAESAQLLRAGRL